jgi:hypothetical protein
MAQARKTPKATAVVGKRKSRPPAETTFRDRTLDARPDRLDLRDLPYRPPLRSLPPRFPDDSYIRGYLSSYVREGLILNQGTEGACTGFGLACVVNYLLWIRHLHSASKARFQRASPRMLYEMAKRYDEWPGQDYEGSSCRGGLKGWHKHGVCGESLWPYPLARDDKPVFVRPSSGWDVDATTRPLGVYYRVDRASVVDMQAAIAEIGAVYVSANVHDGWDELVNSRKTAPAKNHAQLPVIPAPKKPKDVGGHSFAIVGYNECGFVVQNSWGLVWGASGFGILPYDDWVEHATDAWACALGVAVLLPDLKGRMRPLVASRWRVGSGRSLTTIDRSARNADNPPEDPWPIDHAFDCNAYQPWSTHEAYLHTLVSGNDGQLIVSDMTRASSDVADYARDIVVDQPSQWFKDQDGSVLKLAIYAHGGLNSEEDSIKRIRVLAPYFAANGVYPLFVTWKTGPGETLCDVMQDWARKVLGADADRAGGLLDALGDAKDRAIEAIGHVLGRGIWSEMRENAELGEKSDHSLNLLARNLAALSDALDKNGKRLELHLVGHSAGSILVGHLLDQMLKADPLAKPPGVKTCTLYAAACSTRFAVEHYLPAAQAGLLNLQKLWLYYLTDDNEKKDGLPSPGVPAYGKSLLYLVSRALDDRRKMPLLGMQRALDPGYAKDDDQWAAEELQTIRDWLANWQPAAGQTVLGVPVATPNVRNTKTGGQIQATHGSFDNNIEALTDTLRRIKGGALIAPIEWLDY